MLHLSKFLDKIRGEWYSHQTIYFVSKKKVKNYKSNNNIVLNSKQVNDDIFKNKLKIKYNNKFSDYIVNNKDINYTILKTTSINNYSDYQLYLLNDNFIKVSSKCKISNIDYIEYIYSININFRISIIFLKQANKCFAVSLNSCIRKVD